MSKRSLARLAGLGLGLVLCGCGGGSSAPDAQRTDEDAGGSPDAGDGANLPEPGVPLGDPWSARYGDPGPLPDRVVFRTNTETFNRQYYFAARDGGIWWKPNDEATGVVGDWQALVLPPEIDGRVFEISADDNEMIALTVDRAVWTMTGALFDPTGFSWKVNWGMPFWNGPGQSLPDWVFRWEWSVLSPQEDIYWIDPAGNHQPVGLAKVSHIWMLPTDQVRLTYIDPWLPLDFSYGMCGPLRDRFRSENLAASGSTVFVINRYGDMFTRLFDFDMSGADTVFFRYSYEDQTGVTGSPPIQLPAVDWVKQPKIEGRITNLIGIFKIGEGAVHRTLRVEGEGPGGVTGYFEKDVVDLDAAAWVFHETGLPLRGIPLDNRKDDSSAEDLGEASDLSFTRNIDRLDALSTDAIQSDADWAAEIPSFNAYCSPTTLRIHVSRDVTFDLVAHTADAIRGEPRVAGLDGSPRDFTTTLELPQALLDSLANQPAKVRAFIEQYLGARRFTPVALYATTDELVICVSGATLDRSCAVEPWRFVRQAP